MLTIFTQQQDTYSFCKIFLFLFFFCLLLFSLPFSFLPSFLSSLTTITITFAVASALTHLKVSGLLSEQCCLAQKHIKSKGLIMAMGSCKFLCNNYESVHQACTTFALLAPVPVNWTGPAFEHLPQLLGNRECDCWPSIGHDF